MPAYHFLLKIARISILDKSSDALIGKINILDFQIQSLCQMSNENKALFAYTKLVLIMFNELLLSVLF